MGSNSPTRKIQNETKMDQNWLSYIQNTLLNVFDYFDYSSVNTGPFHMILVSFCG